VLQYVDTLLDYVDLWRFACGGAVATAKTEMAVTKKGDKNVASNMCGKVMTAYGILFGKHQGRSGHRWEDAFKMCVGDTDCGLDSSGTGEGVMTTFNPSVTLVFEFQLPPRTEEF
jgi:hypothetical protein